MTEKHTEELDRELFVRLLTKHDRVTRAFLRGFLPTSSEVDEVMQEVSVVAWRKFAELDAPDNFRRWVCVIARYEALMHRRKKARDRIVLGRDIEELVADEGLEELSLREQQLAALEGCLEKLPRERKDVVLSVYATDQSMKVVAEQIGKAPAALYKVLSRARRELRRCIERTLGEADPC